MSVSAEPLRPVHLGPRRRELLRSRVVPRLTMSSPGPTALILNRLGHRGRRDASASNRLTNHRHRFRACAGLATTSSALLHPRWVIVEAIASYEL